MAISLKILKTAYELRGVAGAVYTRDMKSEAACQQRSASPLTTQRLLLDAVSQEWLMPSLLLQFNAKHLGYKNQCAYLIPDFPGKLSLNITIAVVEVSSRNGSQNPFKLHYSDCLL